MNNFLKIRNEESMIQGINMLRFPEDYKNKIYLFPVALNYIFSYRKQTKNTIKNTEILFLSKNFLNIIKREERYYRDCIDILDRNIPEFDFLDIVRKYDERKEERKQRVERVERKDETKSKEKIKLVYDDSQNSHNSSINKSVVRIACFLCDKYKHINQSDDVFENIINILLVKFPNETETIVENIDFIKTNTSYFDESKKVTLKKVFISVWLWMTENIHFLELQNRLIEEMKEMNGYCTTGHLARLINVIQGYEQDENLKIKISLQNQCDAVVSQYITSELSRQCDNEEIQDGMIRGNEVFIKFIKKIIKAKIQEWIKFYGKEAFPYLTKSINTFCNVEVFKVT